jgi:hypothetical protein
MPYKKLLEEYPLYRKFQNPRGEEFLPRIEKPAIHMHCEKCDSEQTFLMTNHYFEGHGVHERPTHNAACHCRYVCTSCQEFERHFWIQYGPKSQWIMKVGQHPAWQITPDAVLEKTLGTRSHLYKKGLVCESQSYGIGAFAYYRRMVEEIINDLLDEITELIPNAEKPSYEAALAKTKQTRVTQDKIDLVKDLLPPILLPEGMNPLGVLHSALSEGLHGQSDEHCLELAEQIREILVFLVNQVSATRSSAKSFTSAMRKLLDKKA